MCQIDLTGRAFCAIMLDTMIRRDSPMTTVQLNFRLPGDLKRAAQHVAVERGDSLSEVIRVALRDYVDQFSEEAKQAICQLGAERNCS